MVVVTDATIDRLYPGLLAPYEKVLIGLGESIKTLRTVEELYRRFIELGVDRKSFVLGVGGGIVTDVAGFAASTYMRGIGFGFVSTTLLGQIDASVGGKNGVNVDGYKNMAGTLRSRVCHLRSGDAAEPARAGVPGRAGRSGQGGRYRRCGALRPARGFRPSRRCARMPILLPAPFRPPCR